MRTRSQPSKPRRVALRQESVDRNYGDDLAFSDGVVVALRKESVDRNCLYLSSFALVSLVALRKESVDRNNAVQIIVVIVYSRSPQGERG